MDSSNMHTNAALLGVPCLTLHERTLCACPLLPCALIGSFSILLSNCISQSESGHTLANNPQFYKRKFKSHRNMFSVLVIVLLVLFLKNMLLVLS